MMNIGMPLATVVALAALLPQSSCANMAPDKLQVSLRSYFGNARVYVEPSTRTLVGVTCVQNPGPEMITMVSQKLQTELGGLQGVFVSAMGYRDAQIAFDNSVVRVDFATRSVTYETVIGGWKERFDQMCGFAPGKPVERVVVQHDPCPAALTPVSTPTTTAATSPPGVLTRLPTGNGYWQLVTSKSAIVSPHDVIPTDLFSPDAGSNGESAVKYWVVGDGPFSAAAITDDFFDKVKRSGDAFIASPGTYAPRCGRVAASGYTDIECYFAEPRGWLMVGNPGKSVLHVTVARYRFHPNTSAGQ